MKPGIATLTLVVVAFFAGMSATLFLVPFWIVPFSEAISKSANPADWIGFVGNFGAGIMTLVGAVIAWMAIQRQIQAQETALREAEDRRNSERLQVQIEARQSAVDALVEPVEAAAALVYSLRRAEAATETDEIFKWDDTVEKACAMFGGTLQHFSLSVFVSDLAWEDRRKYIKTLGVLSSFHIFTGKRPDTIPREKFLSHVIDECRVLQTSLMEFDERLGTTFEKESKVGSP
jgi:hypothetical protein